MVTINMTDNNVLILKHCINKRINEIDLKLNALNNIDYKDTDVYSLYNERMTLLFLLKLITNNLKEVKS